MMGVVRLVYHLLIFFHIRSILIDVNFCSDSATRITITREQSLKLQKLFREKPAGKRKWTDQEIRKNASRLKIPAVKIRYYLKQRNALAEVPNRTTSSMPIDVEKPRSKIFSDLSFEKKVALLRKTRTATTTSVRLTQELSEELQIPESKIYNWLKHKVHRNLRMKKSLSVQETAALNQKFAEYDYLDDDSALLLADRFNVNPKVIKKAFQHRTPVSVPNAKPVTPVSSQNVKPVIEVKKLLQLPASVTITPVPKVTTAPKVTPVPKVATVALSKSKSGTKKKANFKTVDQKNALFEAFRQSPSLTRNEAMAELMEKTGLIAPQICKWLSVVRAKWAQSTESSLKKALTRGLTTDQLVALERSYRGERFLTSAQLIELPKTVGMTMRALQAWFSDRRIYEIRSSDKDLVNIGPRTVAARKETSQSSMLKPSTAISESTQQEEPRIGQPAEYETATEFFESLSKEQKGHLKAACNNYNVSYKRLAQALSLPTEKVEHYIKSYRVRHAMFRVSKSTLPERVHKALLNHYMKYGKISSKTSVVLAKRLKVRPEQIVNWNKSHTKRVLAVGGFVKPTPIVPAAKPIVVVEPSVLEVEEPIADAEPEPDPLETYEEVDSTPSASIPGPVRRSFSKKGYGKGGKRYYAAAAAKVVLFEEYKASPEAATTTSKIKQLANMVKLTPLQVRKWLYNFGKRLKGQTKSKVVDCLNNPEISDELRARLEELYRDCRFMEESEMEALAQEFGSSRKHITNWFINARYYEVLVGQCPGEADTAVRTKTPTKSASSSKTFYAGLDSEKQARLDEELDSYPFDDDKLDDLAEELEVPSKDLKKWFDNPTRVKRSRRSLSQPSTPLNWLNLTIKQMETLVNEFEADPIMSDERAAAMARRIKLAKGRIKVWFENRRQELQIENSDDSDNAKPTKQRIPPIKIIMPKYTNSNDEMPTIAPSADTSKDVCKIRLFEEFKRSSSLTSERLVKISQETNLSGRQVSAWFSWLNEKLSKIPRDTLSEENLNKDLTPEQIEALEKQYAENRYANRSSRESLSLTLGLPKNVVKSWFANRRYQEILCQDESVAEDYSSQYEDINDPEMEHSTEENAISYKWDEENTETIDESADPLEQKFDVKRPLEIDPLLDDSYGEEQNEDIKMDVYYNFQLSPNNAFDQDLTSLPYEPRDRFVTPLGDDLEPLEEDVEKLFWFMSKKPNTNGEKYDQNIDEAKNRILESEFGKYPWPNLDRISKLSAQLLVSEPKIHWWFIKKRCFLTKTILTLPAHSHSKMNLKPEPENLLIDLTDDDAMNDMPAKCGEFEFVTLDETAQIKKEEEPMTEDDTLENGDPFENNSIDDQLLAHDIEEEPLVESNESTNNIGSTSTNSATASATKKKKKKIPLTSHQRAVLMQEYKRNKFISGPQARMLARDLGVSVNRVDTWFDSMRKSNAQKKPTVVETSVSVKSLSPELESGLEAEYLKSVNLTAKRAKMIALKLKTKTKTVQKWFMERAKRKDHSSQS